MRSIVPCFSALLLGLAFFTAACNGGGGSSDDGEIPQSDFMISVVAKTGAHPYFGVGHAVGFAVNGVEGDELTLTRGMTYTFGINSPGHPLYITTDAAGDNNAAGEETNGVMNSRVQRGILTFTPDGSTPNLVYYHCALHPNMGWRINIIN
jgi:hypothetical protein